MTNRILVSHTVETEIAPDVFLFSAANPNWSREPHYNEIFLRAQADYWQQVLQHRGHFFLNDALDGLNMTRTSHGAVAGWLHDFEKPGRIDARIKSVVNDGLTEYELSFHTEGIIYDLI